MKDTNPGKEITKILQADCPWCHGSSMYLDFSCDKCKIGLLFQYMFGAREIVAEKGKPTE